MAAGVAVFHQPRITIEHTVAEDTEAERHRVYAAFDTIRREVEALRPDAIVIIGVDHGRIYTYANLPAFVLDEDFSYFVTIWTNPRILKSGLPFSLTLLKFSFDRYAGTDIAKNFSSRVRLRSDDGRDDREVLIYMNNPLRYGGYTFYQADYDHEKEQYTILQVVRNPSWSLPYIACAVMTLGLLWQFGYHLAGFIAKRGAKPQAG